jgi:endonuclease-8
MPEGDTILRAARTLARRLQHKTILAFSSTVPSIARADLLGHAIVRVEARGKNLLVHFDDGRALHTHMRMTGSWHVYLPGERWQRPASFARVVLEVEGCVAVCFSAPVVELFAPGRADTARDLASLGPDILAPMFDIETAVANLKARGSMAIGEAVLDQRLVAGIGNIYKSETLFLERVDPFCRVDTLADDRLIAILVEARRLMTANLAPGSGMRTTTHRRAGTRARHFTYGRSGEPCLVCGDRIRMRRQGTALRSTYYCPTCQSAAA